MSKIWRRRPRINDARATSPELLAELLVESSGIAGYRRTLDQPSSRDKLSRLAEAGHRRAWSDGEQRSFIVVVTLERYPSPLVARLAIIGQRRRIQGVLDRFKIVGVPAAFGLQITKPGALQDGSSGFGNVVLFSFRSYSVVISHMGRALPQRDVVTGLALRQYEHLVQKTA